MNVLHSFRSLHRLALKSAIGTVVVAGALVAMPAVASANVVTPTLTSLTVSANDVTARWSLNVTNATSIDVILFDVSGNVVADDSLDPSATVDTFVAVPNGDGYYVDVIAATPLGPVDSGASTPLTVNTDGAPTIDSIDGSSSALTVTWTANATDATGYDVTLYDANGNVVASDVVGSAATADTLTAVADGTGYYVSVTVHTPGGDLVSEPTPPFSMSGGTYIVDPVSTDGAPTLDSIDGSSGTITINWTANALDATGYDVTLYDANGNVVANDVLGAAATADTLTAVVDGTGYYVVVTAHTPNGDFTSDASTSFTVFNGNYSNDSAVQMQSADCVGGTLSVSWISNSPDATGFDVLLLDANGNVVADHLLGADATTDTFANVADGQGYSVEVVAHTPVGDLSATSWSFDILDGATALVPIGPPVVVGGSTGIVVDPSTVTITPTNSDVGGWTVSWPDLANAGTDGYYLVTTDQGDDCTALPTGSTGATVSCVLSALNDPSVSLTGLTVTFEPHFIAYDTLGATLPTAMPAAHAVKHRAGSHVESTTPVTKRSVPVNKPLSLGSLAPASHSSNSSDALIAASALVLTLAALATVLLRRQFSRRSFTP